MISHPPSARLCQARSETGCAKLTNRWKRGLNRPLRAHERVNSARQRLIETAQHFSDNSDLHRLEPCVDSRRTSRHPRKEKDANASTPYQDFRRPVAFLLLP